MKKLILLILLAMPYDAYSAACTDQVDCLCDCYANTDGVGNDVGGGVYANSTCQSMGRPIRSSVVACEDTEASSLTGPEGYGTSTYPYGPWNDGGTTTVVGSNSYWSRTYGKQFTTSWESCTVSSGEQCQVAMGFCCSATNVWGGWDEGEGGCSTPGGAYGCYFPCEWTSGNPWNCELPDGSYIDVVSSTAEFDDEWSGLGIPDTNGTSDDRGIWDGQNVWGHRVPAGILTTSGESAGVGTGHVDFGASYSTIGITMMVALDDSQTGSSSPCTASNWAWKGFEPGVGQQANGSALAYSWPISNCAQCATCLGGTQNNTDCYSLSAYSACLAGGGTCPGGNESGCSPSKFPVSFSLRWDGVNSTGAASDCSAATQTIGHCNGTGGGQGSGGVVSFCPIASVTQSANAPVGDWVCVRSKITGMNTSSGRVEHWVNDVKSIDVSNLNFTHHFASSWRSLFLNGYANVNQGDGCDQTDNAGRRWYDNIVIVGNGDPVSCAEIGATAADTWTINTFNLSNPSTCTQGACSAAADAYATADGTASGTISWEIDNDCDIATGLNYVDIDTLGSGVVCTNSNTCNRADVCDYSAKTAGTYTATIRSCVGAICGTATDTFQVLAPAAGEPGGRKRGGGVLRSMLENLENLYADPYNPLPPPAN